MKDKYINPLIAISEKFLMLLIFFFENSFPKIKQMILVKAIDDSMLNIYVKVIYETFNNYSSL